jgi:hypothetical protein
MDPEYIIKVGDLFVDKSFINIGSIHFDIRQKEAERYDKEKMVKVAIWLKTLNVEPEVYRIDGLMTRISSIELEVSEDREEV